MISLDPLFIEAKGKPILWNGQSLVRIDRVALTPYMNLRLQILHVDSKYQQGIIMETDLKNHQIIADDKVYGNRVVFWEKEIGFDPVTIKIKAKSGTLFISNCWSEETSSIRRWTMNHAMSVEERSNTSRIYYCNDGDLDITLSDIVFRIDML